MDIKEAIKMRHSVRAYNDKLIEEDKITKIENAIREINEESGLHIQLIKNEPKAFAAGMAHYGGFRNVNNYIAMIGKTSADIDEKCGYYGEKLVLYAKTLGLNTCWVALTYKRIPEVMSIEADERVVVVITIGYSDSEGSPHKVKSIESISNVTSDSPDWFRNGVESALLAPTAVNQQKFRLELIGDKVKAIFTFGPYTKLDLGIVKYHFEVGADKGRDIWINS